MTARRAPLPSGRAIGPIGTIARICVGVVLIGAAVNNGIQPADAALAVAGAAVLLAWQLARLRWAKGTLQATGPVAFTVNAAIAVALFSVETTRDAALLFYGVSLLLAAARGYAGCEVLAISNWLLRRDDQVGCVVLSPIDAAERAMTDST